MGKIIKKTNSKKQTDTSNSKISENTNVSSTETESVITNNEIDKFVATPNEEIKKEEPKIIETVQESISKLLNDKSVRDYYYYLSLRTILTESGLTMRKTVSDHLFLRIEACYDALFVKNDLTLAKKLFVPLESIYSNYQDAVTKHTRNEINDKTRTEDGQQREKSEKSNVWRMRTSCNYTRK